MTADVTRFQFRLVLLGSNRTGKTSILNRFLFKKFETKYKPTVEDLFSQDFDLGSIVIKVDFLDTSGSMQFPAMRRLSLTTASAFLIVYSLDDEQSFAMVKMIMDEIQEARHDFQEIPIVFVGNKCDIPKDQRKVTKELVSNYVYYELPRIRTKVIECSCKDDLNIDNIFKAYLSLAKVSLSSAMLLTSTSKRKHFSPVEQTVVDQQEPQADRTPTTTTTSSNSSSFDSNNNHANSSTAISKQTQQQQTQSRPSSIKFALGVRKSCDASIISPMKILSIHSSASSPSSSREHLVRQPAGATSDRSAPGQQFTQVVLKDAMQQSNSFGSAASKSGHGSSSSSGAKPRSRSLIWRPQRKSSRNSASKSQDCRVS